MSGYTPVFDTVFNGTLCGRWPVLPVWLTLLPLADWRGHIDMTYEAIAGRTGWPLNLLKEGIQELMKPDPHSRTKAEAGRRLVPLDEERGWGWQVVNISVYRAKASGRDQVEDGRNAEKVRRYKDRHRRTPEDTPKHQGDTYSNTDSNTDSNQDQSGRAARGRPARQVPESFEVTEDMRTWVQRECPGVNADAETAKFRDHEFAKPRSDWLKAWRNWMRRSGEFGPNSGKSQDAPRKTRYEQLYGS